MDKPFTLKVQETGKEVANILNKSQLPLFVLKTILQGIYAEMDDIDNEEIRKYNEEIVEQLQNKKESDK